MQRGVYICPICLYHGHFKDVDNNVGRARFSSQCPHCGGRERQRLLKLVLSRYQSTFFGMNCAHFSPVAPESFALQYFKNVSMYNADGIDVDLSDASILADDSFDVLLAVHVMEHIRDDMKALSEISRISKIAILPVPIERGVTEEFTKRDVDGHVRKTGEDYYARYRDFFKKIHIYQSSDFSPIYQTHMIMKDGTWIEETMPVCFRD